MKNREQRLWRVLGAIALAVGLWGCDQKPQASKPAAPPPPRPNAAPAVTTQAPEAVAEEQVEIAAMLTSLKADARVQFPQERACADRSLAESVIRFASGFAKGDDGMVGALLAPDARAVLEQLVGGGDWETATARIEGVRVVSLNQDPEDGSATSASLQLAIQEPGEAYVLAWAGVKEGQAWAFTASPASDGIKPRASDWDGGAAAAVEEPDPEEPAEDQVPPDASDEQPEPEPTPDPAAPSKRPGRGG